MLGLRLKDAALEHLDEVGRLKLNVRVTYRVDHADAVALRKIPVVLKG